MVAVAPASCNWIAEDDLLLKNSVESGASLEALAKGAVKFSRRFSFHELRERWHSLLYDPDVSSRASARMVELELSDSNPVSKVSRWDDVSGGGKVPWKRKSGSIRRQYYAMRKRIKSEFFTPPDLAFFDEPNIYYISCGRDFQGHVALNAEAQVGESLIGDCIVNNLGLHETDFEILRQVFPETMGVVATDSAVVDPGKPFPKLCESLVENSSPNRLATKDTVYGFSDDISSLVTNDVSGSLEPKIEHRDAPRVIKDESNNLRGCISLGELGSSQIMLDGKACVPKQVPTYDSMNENKQTPCSNSASLLAIGFACTMNVNQTQNAEKLVGTSDDSGHRGDGAEGVYLVNPSSVSEGELHDISDSLLNFTNDDELLFIGVDGKDMMDKSCYDIVDSREQSSSKEVEKGDTCITEHKQLSDTCLVVPSVLYTAESENVASLVRGSKTSAGHVEDRLTSVSTSKRDPYLFTEGVISCILNTEETEIPCNDDIFLLIHPSTSFDSPSRPPVAKDAVDPVFFSADEKDSERSPDFLKKGKHPSPSFTWSEMTTPKRARDLSQSRAKHAASKTLANGVLVEDVPEVRPRTVQTADMFREAVMHGDDVDCDKVTVPEQIPNASTSDKDESDSESDIPYFSDIEAMIHEMDLVDDQDASISRQVARYQNEDAKRMIIRLEQTARSSLQRAMASLGALAILYGRHLKHYVKKTEVILGRSTDDMKVDIDLRKEGRANRISRRQASIKMEPEGSFSLKNLGKSTISVNGKTIANGETLALASNSLIEIKGMSFVFEINDKYVRWPLDNLPRRSNGKHSNFDWSPDVGM